MFFCNEAIENEDDYILIGLVEDEVVELVPAHQDCANSRSDHVELFEMTFHDGHSQVRRRDRTNSRCALS